MWQWIPFDLHYDHAKKKKKERKQSGYESKAN